MYLLLSLFTSVEHKKDVLKSVFESRCFPNNIGPIFGWTIPLKKGLNVWKYSVYFYYPHSKVVHLQNLHQTVQLVPEVNENVPRIDLPACLRAKPLKQTIHLSATCFFGETLIKAFQ